jgi:hypothetical protein
MLRSYRRAGWQVLAGDYLRPWLHEKQFQMPPWSLALNLNCNARTGQYKTIAGGWNIVPAGAQPPHKRAETLLSWACGDIVCDIVSI